MEDGQSLGLTGFEKQRGEDLSETCEKYKGKQ